MSKVVEELRKERLELCKELGRAGDKLEEAQKEYDSIKAKLDFRDEMLDKLMEEEIPERSYPERAEDVVGKIFYMKDGMEVIIVSYNVEHKRLSVGTKDGSVLRLTFADIDWDTEHSL